MRLVRVAVVKYPCTGEEQVLSKNHPYHHHHSPPMLYPTFHTLPSDALHILDPACIFVSTLPSHHAISTTHRFEIYAREHDNDKDALASVQIDPAFALVECGIDGSVCRHATMFSGPVAWVLRGCIGLWMRVETWIVGVFRVV